VSPVTNTHQRLQQGLLKHRPLKLAGRYPEAAVLVAISDDLKTPALLLTKRAQHLAIHSGEVAFPGGKRDPGDSNLLATALREAQEEVALAPASFQYLGCLDERITRTNIKVTPFVGVIPATTPLIANRDELDSLFYAPLDFLCRPENLCIDSIPYQGEVRQIPRFDYGGYSIWGVTAMIIVDLMNTVFEADLPLPLPLQRNEGE
jgi:8-oxo-dGTP pyrophosphatase MutT (NUDIX family)